MLLPRRWCGHRRVDPMDSPLSGAMMIRWELIHGQQYHTSGGLETVDIRQAAPILFNYQRISQRMNPCHGSVCPVWPGRSTSRKMTGRHPKSIPAKPATPASGAMKTAAGYVEVKARTRMTQSPSSAASAGKGGVLQIPNHKHQISNKFQITPSKSQTLSAAFWNLRIGTCLVFAICLL